MRGPAKDAGVFFAGKGVELAAHALNLLGDLLSGAPASALEQQMLNKM
jgi:hypothetical protein